MFASLIDQILSTSIWEAIAVLLGFLYLALAIRENGWCWHAAFWSTAISIYLFWDVNLLMESALNVYYLLMAVYGWYQWRFGGTEHQPLAIQHWPLTKHLIAICSVLVLSAISGYYLSRHTQAAWPYLDSFTTWGAVLTTYLVARKVLENWLYWLVIDGLSIYLYCDRGLFLYALLFAIYLVMVIFGYIRWRQEWLNESLQSYEQQPA